MQSSTGVSYHQVSAAPVALVGADRIRRTRSEHAAGSEIAIRTPLLDVTALDRGRWGNRLRISVEDEVSGLTSNAAITGLITAVELQLSTISGLQPGSNIEVNNPASGASIVLKVRSATRRRRGSASRRRRNSTAAALVYARAGRPAARPTCWIARIPADDSAAARPDPAEPSRNEEVISNEVFRISPRSAVTPAMPRASSAT